MNRVLVKSVFDAFEYVMQHYYPAGMEDMVERADTYAVISIQDSHTDGFGITFSKNKYCKDVLTLKFDDIVRPVEGEQLFSEEMAEDIIRFIIKNKDKVETLLIHCYAGQSRSRAVGAFAAKMLGGNSASYFNVYNLNEYVYTVLEQTFPYVYLTACTQDNMDTYEDVNLYEPLLSNEELNSIEYTGNEFKEVGELLEEFCRSIPTEGMWPSYLCTADELNYLYGEILSIMEEEHSEENKKRVAVYAHEITKIIQS